MRTIKSSAVFHSIYSPHYIVIVTILMSFAAWSISNVDIRRGFLNKESLTLETILLLVLWYSTISIFSFVGYRIGKQMRPASILNKDNDRFIYKTISILSFFGILFTIFYSIGIEVVIDGLSDNQANNLKFALYDNYVIGLNSLRYLTILAGAIGCYKIIAKNQYYFIHFLNLICLFINALISNRLSLFMAAFLVLGLFYKKNNKANFSATVVIAFIFVALLLIFNVTRNYHFYSNIGVESPSEMLIAEVLTYVGSPFQVSVGVGNNYDKFPNHLYLFLNSILPTYIHSLFGYSEWETYLEGYRRYVDVESTLTTNSSFCSLYVLGGWYSYLFIACSSFMSALFAGHFVNYNNYMSLITFIIFYCFAELWRIYIFNNGIIHMLVLTLLLGTLLGNILSKWKMKS